MPGHIGVYVGGGEVIEATPSWENGVQRTKLSARKWQLHGMMPQVEYVEDEPDTVELMRTKENLHMRSGAGTRFASLMVIPKGADVQVVSITSGRAKVSYKGKIGYSSADYLMAVPSRKGGEGIASVLNVRSGPGTQNRIMGTLLKGAKVEILATVSGWHKIRYGTGEAYVSADYIEESNTVVVETKRGRVVNCSYLNIRQTPGGKAVGTYKVGDVVTILEKNGSWYKTDKGYSSVNYIKLI
ncbi:MAG TPA: hypothetical protein DHM90_05775 [Clostridiaceae bacterium]|nr:hypothetical protein [Clostridiaceae bacterium]